MFFNLLTVAGFAALSLAPGISAAAVAAPAPQETSPAPPAIPNLVEMRRLHNFEDAFTILESVPADLIEKEDEAAIHKWINENVLHVSTGGGDDDLEKRQFWSDALDVGQCAWQILQFLPPLRVLRILTRLGGGYRAARRLTAAVKNGGDMEGPLKDLFDIVTGYFSVKKECIDDFR